MKDTGQRFSKGFTLVELLVVIAIIGMLMGIIIASIISARNKATDKAVAENLLTIRSQANLYFDTAGAGSYGTATPPMPTGTNCEVGMFTDDQIVARAIAKIKTYISPDHVACTSTGQAFAVAAQLTNQNYFCIDSASAGRINSGRGRLYDISGTDSTAAINTITSLCH